MARKALLEFRRDTAANWTTANPVLAAGEPGWESDTNKLKIGDGTTAWSSLAYFSAAGSGVTSIDGISGAVTLTAGTNVTITDNSPVAGDITIASSGGGAAAIGSSALVYRYTVTGADKASIDTGVDTPDAGSNNWTNGDLLEIVLMGRTDEAVARSVVNINLNNDSGGNYDYIYVTTVNATVSGNNVRAGTSWQFNLAGASAAAGVFGTIEMRFPNFTGIVAQKVGSVRAGVPDQVAASMQELDATLGYRSTSALTRFLIAPATAGKKLKVGSQLLIYKRLAA